MEMKLNAFLTFIFWSSTILSNVTNKSLTKFPDDFIFGVSTAAYQIEGGWDEDGKGMSVWDYMVHTDSGSVLDGTNGDVTSDSYHLYKRDVQLLEELGVDSYKFSISWPRILPNGTGQVSAKGIAYYNSLINELLAKGIQPFVGIYHWDIPQALQEKGGLVDERFPTWFAEYARILFQNFGDRVKDWITFNEPGVNCMLVYEYGIPTPRAKSPGRGFYECNRMILLAHAKVYHMYTKEFKPSQKGKLGINLYAPWAIPSSNSSDDIEAVEDYKAFQIGLCIDPIYSKLGNYPQRVIDRIQLMSSKQGLNSSRLPALTDEEIEYIRGTADFMAINHYATDIVYRNASMIIYDHLNRKVESPSLFEDQFYSIYKDPGREQSVIPEVGNYPKGFYDLLLYLRDTYDNPEIYVIENGAATNSGLIDDVKVEFMRNYLSALKDALEAGVRIKGYYFWNLLDDFTWVLGYIQKFGLYEVDMKSPNRTRTARKSALVYKEIIRSRVIDYEYDPDPLIGRNGAMPMTGHSLIGLLFIVIFTINVS